MSKLRKISDIWAAIDHQRPKDINKKDKVKKMII